MVTRLSKSFLFTCISTSQTGSSKILQPTLPKVVIESIYIMTPGIVVLTKALDFLWISYRGACMLTSSQPEDSHSKYSGLARLGYN